MTITEGQRRAKAKMERTIEAGRASAIQVFEQVNRDMPNDKIVRGRALGFNWSSPAAYLNDPANADAVDIATGLPLAVAALLEEQPGPSQLAEAPEHVVIPDLVLDVAGETERLHRHALDQLSQRAGLPQKHIREGLAHPIESVREAWRNVLARYYGETDLSDSRYLLRSVAGELRGFLSDRYRRLDSRPLLETFAESCQIVGAIPVHGHASDLRVAVQAILPRVFEPVPGEVMMIGLEWHNSDFGCGRHTLRIFIERLDCSNGMTRTDSLSNRHLGGRLDEDIEFSQRTYALDTETTRSALRDVVLDQLSEKNLDRSMALVAAANEKRVDRSSFARIISKSLTKGERAKALELWDDEHDVERLPAGSNAWRASNVLSWMAGKVDGDRKLELQRIAGKVLESAEVTPKAA